MNDARPVCAQAVNVPRHAKDAIGTPSETIYRCASQQDTLEASFRLVYNSYRRAGLINPNPFGMRVPRALLSPDSQVLVAGNRGTITSTMSLVVGDEVTLPMESVFPDIVQRQRAKGDRCAEVTSLADRRIGLRRALPVLRWLMSLTAQYATYQGIGRLLIAVHPRHTSFYRGFLGFSTISGEATYSDVRNHPAVAMVLDLPNLAEDYPDGYRRLFGVPIDEEQLKHRPLPADVRRYFQEISLLISCWAAGNHGEPAATADATRQSA